MSTLFAGMVPLLVKVSVCDEITEIGAIYICGLNKCVWLIRVYFYRNWWCVVVVVTGGLVGSG